MALLKTIDELKSVLAVNKGLSIDSLLPDIKRIESKYILPTLGQALYDKLVPLYETPPGSLTQEETNILKLVPYVQAIIGPLAMALYGPLAQVQISDSGWRRVEDGNFKTAYSGQISEVRDYLWEMGLDGIESIYEFLEINSADYPDWTADTTASTLNKLLIINSAEEILDYYALTNSRRTYKALQPIIKRVEELYISPAISVELYTEIKDEIKNDNVSTDNQALLVLLKPAVAYKTLAEAIEMLPVQIDGSSILLQERMISGSNDKSGSRPDALQLERLQQSFLHNAESYLSQAKDLLLAEATASKYAAFFNSDLYPEDGEDPDNRSYVNPTENKIFGAF